MSYLSPRRLRGRVTEADTSFLKDAIGTTLETFDGTLITYTPPPGAQNVVYECQFTTAWTPDANGSYPCVRLQYSDDSGSTWNTITGTECFLGNNSGSSDYNWHSYLVVYTIAAWAGSRQLRMIGRAFSSSTEFTLGRSYRSVGAEGAGACPIVSCYSVM